MVTIVTSAFFAALSGSASATCASIGSMMVPEMEEQGYRKPQALAIAAAGAKLRLDVKSALKGPIHERIAFYNSLMAQDRFKICSRCTQTIKALERAVYDAKRPLEDVRLDDGSTNIDSLDSMEYTTEPVQNDILYPA